MPKKQKLEPTPQECFLPVPQQGPFTDVPHPELYAVEPSTYGEVRSRYAVSTDVTVLS